MRIDAHQHFWSVQRPDYGWLTPDLGRIYRDFGPDDLRPHLAAGRIDGTVLVQAAATVAETDYMLSVADAAPLVRGVVGWIDFERPGDLASLDRLCRHPLFRGVRPMIQDIADDRWMLRPDLDWAFRAVIERDLTFDALVFPRHLPHVLRLAERYPDLRMVIDHGAKPGIAAGGLDGWAADLARVGRETSALCKLSGLITEAGPDWSPARLSPYAGQILSCFGAERVMWGSDWPVLELAATYGDWLATAEALVNEHAGTAAAAAVFGETAARFYRLTPVQDH